MPKRGRARLRSAQTMLSIDERNVGEQIAARIRHSKFTTGGDAMNKFCMGSIGLLLLGGAAPAQAVDWAGFYAGLNAGYALGQSGAKTSAVAGAYFANSSVPAIATAGKQNL